MTVVSFVRMKLNKEQKEEEDMRKKQRRWLICMYSAAVLVYTESDQAGITVCAIPFSERPWPTGPTGQRREQRDSGTYCSGVQAADAAPRVGRVRGRSKSEGALSRREGGSAAEGTDCTSWPRLWFVVVVVVVAMGREAV